MGYGKMDPFAMRTPWLLWQQMARMAWEAQMVIAMRTAGMMGLMRQDAAEPTRMVVEKADAASEAMLAALQAAGRGERADRVMQAALRPYRRRTKANVKRLSSKKP
ncbi:MAG TPA: antibiotic ABC transporter [Paracoccus sp. (in: a-proteobacteria)]|uniref:antibiotic ABC transporter n=1 Tax=Paracoccus sp. TaxID=267 RepID=UPI002B7F9F4A|nr:antibiotic ABC transporter [Paracoccus sp. (in: a-proteobacteria)]HWL56101.1 antibiotic ABC transporter [Paracoccus sp. (in: a-proteobacteria)]